MQANERLQDHALIGNCRAAALVSVKGAINWCCLPEFDSPALFAALLDGEKGGSFRLHPAGNFESTQSVLPGTNVAETCFNTDEGCATLTDCFVAMEETEKAINLFPDHEILRQVTCTRGSLRFRYYYQPRIHYGRKAARLKQMRQLGIHLTFRENVIVLSCSLGPLTVSDDGNVAKGEFTISEGQSVIFSLSCSSQHPAVIPEVRQTAAVRIQQTVQYWKDWIARCSYKGPYHEAVRRSVLTLKLLAHAPSGAIIAAPTTSLPEEIGGSRNWDYRYCWLRDASFTTRVLIRLGYHEEVHAYMNWILHATQLTRPRLQVVYTVFGEANIGEQECHWLGGYENSRPVRVGNDAHRQLQLDVYGEVLDAAFTYSAIIKQFDDSTRRFLIGLGKTICRYCFEPDAGIWEIRSAPQQHTHSKLMAWVGLDRLLQLCHKYKWNAPVAQFEATRTQIRKTIEQSGFNKQVNSYVQVLNGTATDAALLTMPLFGYCNAADERMIATTRYIRQSLGEGPFLYRHHQTDGLSGKEGAFVVASYWLIENLAKQGQVDEAIRLFEALQEHVNRQGLLSEEIDPATGEWLGNYPQGYSHIGLINAALSIYEALEKKQKRTWTSVAS